MESKSPATNHIFANDKVWYMQQKIAHSPMFLLDITNYLKKKKTTTGAIGAISILIVPNFGNKIWLLQKRT